METCCQTRAKILEAQARLMRIAERVNVTFRCPACNARHELDFTFLQIERS